MAAPGSGGRLVALPLTWLAGVALQLQQRDLWRFDVYLSIAALAIAAAAVVVASTSARARHRRRCASRRNRPSWRRG